MSVHPHPPVLVVDDSSVMRTMIARGLVGAGVPSDVLRFAANGKLALESIQADPPGLVVSDVNMPEMTGAEMLEILAEEDRLTHMPVVIVTSISSSRELLGLVRAGAAAVIRKPVDMSSLVSELRPFVQALLEPPEDAPPEEPAPPENPDEPVVDLDLELEHAFVEVLSRVAGCEVQARNGTLADNHVMFAATLPIMRPFDGALWLWADHFSANRLSVALCGVEPGRDDCARLDAVAELLNIVSGEYLALVTEKLGDELHESRFGIPSTFVVAPRTQLPTHIRVLDLGDGDQIAMAVSVTEGDAA